MLILPHFYSCSKKYLSSKAVQIVGNIQIHLSYYDFSTIY